MSPSGHGHGASRRRSWRSSSPQSLASIDPAWLAFRRYPHSAVTNDGLVGFRQVGGVQGVQLVPDLAVALPTPTNGGTAYTFEVRSGIRYSNGKPVQPDDFRRALSGSSPRLAGRAVTTAGSSGPTAAGAGRSATSRAASPRPRRHDRHFHLSEADADFLAKLALPSAVAVPQGVTGTGRGNASDPGHRAVSDRRFPEEDPRRFDSSATPAFREWSVDAQPQGFPDSISVSWRFGFDATSAALRAVGARRRRYRSRRRASILERGARQDRRAVAPTSCA